MSLFPLFETLAIIEGNIQRLEYHQIRYNEACRHYFNVEPVLNLAQIIQIPKEYQHGLVRCKIAYNAEKYHLQFFHYSAKKIEYFQCVHKENIDYRFKYSDRSMFDDCPLSENSEVIILNNGKVSDCTIGNLLFSKKGKWFSPKDYLLQGTQLRYLLDNKKIELCEITLENLWDFEQIMWINALNPFDPSRALAIQCIQRPEQGGEK